VIFAAPATAVDQDDFHVVVVGPLTAHLERMPLGAGLYIAVGGCIATLA
jgi:hypothetical protein